MASVTPERLEKAARLLWAEIYEANFRGKERGRFLLTRGQLKKVLGVERLHDSAIQNLQDVALEMGLAIIDLDDVFPCIEVDLLRRYRRPPTDLLKRLIIKTFPEDPEAADRDIDEDED